MVTRPENYRWSSYRENAGLSVAEIVDRHAFTQLSDFSFEDYRNYLAQNAPSSEAELISQRLEQSTYGRGQICKRGRITNWHQIGIQTTRPTAHEKIIN